MFGQQIPNQFCKWWKLYRPSLEILNPLFKQWVDISPKIVALQKDNIFYDDIAAMYFFIEFSIPWIMKWDVEFGYTTEGIPCLNRIFYTKFWSKLLISEKDGKLYGQALLDQIEAKIEEYVNTKETAMEMKELSPFQKVTRQLQMKKGAISKKEILTSYFEEIKKYLARNFEIEVGDDMSITSG